MAVLPKKTETRIKNGIKVFQRVIQGAKKKDINESDTVTIVTDILADICGYDKYAEITSEYAIRNTFCDLAIKIDNKLALLLEVKAIGLELKENHLRQATNYAANEGIEWVVLTNGDHWRAHRVVFGKPIKIEQGFDFHLSETKPAELLDYFYLISKEGFKKSAIDVFHAERLLTSRYMVAAALQTDSVVAAIRRQLLMVDKKIKISADHILRTITEEVLKREVMDGEEAASSRKKIAAAGRSSIKTKKNLDAKDGEDKQI